VETLPHPNVHLVFDGRETLIHGVPTRKFTKLIEGRQGAFGIKFRPGGFHSFLGRPVAELRDCSIDARVVFGKASVDAYESALRDARTEAGKIRAANSFLLEHLPARDAQAEWAGNLVDLAQRDGTIRTVADLSRHAGAASRTLQRLFHEYVGVTPKWVIQRYRLHELVERLNRGGEMDWAATAAELGYADQSHLIRDFRAIVGRTPGRV
jgi:AraC-like DNA-binding protein